MSRRLKIKNWSIESRRSENVNSATKNTATMDIKKPATLFPSLFKKFVLFITVALCTFFGCIYFFNGGVGLMHGQGTLAEQPFLQLVGNIMGITNISVGKENQNFELILKYHDDGTAAAQSEGQTAEPTDLNLAVKGYVVYDVATGIDINLNFYDKIKLGEEDNNLGILIIDDSEPPIYTISVNSVGNTLFFAINGTTYKIDTTPMFEGGAGVDLSSAFDLIKQNLPFDVDALITKALGFGIDELDMEALGQNPTKLKTGGYQFEIRPASRADEEGKRIYSPLKAIVKTDSNYNIISAEIDQINLENYKIRFSAPDVVMNSNKIKVEQQNPEKFVDLSYINQFVESGANLFKYNQFVDGKATFTLSEKDKTYNANFTIENGEKKGFLIETNIDGLALQVVYKDDFVYVKADDVKVKIGANKKWVEALDRILSTHFDTSVEEKVSEFLEKLTQKLPSENLENTIFGFLTKNLSNPDTIMKVLPQNSVLTGNTLNISWQGGETLTLTRTPQTVLVWEDVPQENELQEEGEEPTKRQVEKQIYVLDTASINLAKENGSIDFDVRETGFEFDATGYENADALLELEQLIDEILTAKKFGGSAKITYKDEPIVGDYVVNFEANKVVIKFTTMLLGEDVEIFAVLTTTAENEISSGEVYVVLGQDEQLNGELSKSKVVIKGDYANLDAYVEKISAFLQKKDDAGADKEEVKSVVTQIKEVLAELVKFDVTIETLYALEHVEVKEDTANVTIRYEDIFVELSAKVSQEEIVVPKENENLLNLLDKASAIKAYIEKQEFAFGFTLKYNNIDLAGKAYINIVDKENPFFEIDGIKLGEDEINMRYADGILYVIYNEKVETKFVAHKMKVDLNKVMAENGLASVIENLLPSLGIEKKENGLSEFLIKMFGQDLTQMSISSILKNAKLDVSGNIENLKFGFDFMGYNGKADVVFANKDLSNVNLTLSKENKKEISLGVSLGEFESEFASLDGFYDLISQHSGKVTLNLYGKEIVLDAELDITQDVRLKLAGNVLGIDVEVLLCNNKLSVKLDDVVLSGTIDKAFIDEVKKLLPASEKKSIEEILDLIDNKNINIQQIVKLAFGDTLSVSKQINENISISATFDETSNLVIEEPRTSANDIVALLPKVKNLLDYVNAGKFGAKFSVNYNKTSTRAGLDLSGSVAFVLGNEKLKTTNEMLVTIDNVFGETIQIRMHFDNTEQKYVLYISIGNNIKIKQAIDQKADSTEVTQGVEQAAKSTLGVELDLGILANIIDLFKLDVKGILDTLDLGISYDSTSQAYGLTVDTKAKTVPTDKLLLSATIKFVDDKLLSDDSITFDVYNGYLSGALGLVENVSIEEFSEETYKDYKDYVSGILNPARLVENEMQVTDDIFAFSSDIAIRYMFSDFYGELTVMLIKDDNFKASFGGLRPVVQLYTTSLGLQTYIYLLDEISNGEIVHMIYADVNGLLLKMELSEANINHLLDFIENDLGISLKKEQESEGQAESVELEEIQEQVEETKEAFRVVIPLLTNIFAKWTEIVQDEQTLRNGIQIDVDGKLIYAEASWFENIFAQILVDTTDGIAPQRVVIGADITDGNTKPFAEDTKFPKDENGNPTEWHLTDADGTVFEIAETQNLNFAVYLSNFTLGKVADIDQKFGGEVVDGAHRLKNITKLQTNNGLVALTEFNDLDAILPAVKTIYDYFKSFKYKIVIDRNEGGMINLGSTKITNIGADITIEVAKIPDETANPSGIKLFNGRSLKVQAYLDFEISSITDEAAQTWSAPVRHLIDILYDSQGEGLYVAYTHGKNINADNINNSTKLRVFIKNESMSELIAMVFAAFRVNLGDELAEDLNIVGKNQTDFTFFQELMGIEGNDKSGDMTRVSTLLNDISSALKLLKSLKFEKVDGITSLAAMLDLSEFDFKSGDKTLTRVKLNLDETSGKLKLSNIEIKDNSFINLKVQFNDFVANFDYLTRNSQQHFDFSSLPTFVDMLVNTLNTKGLNLHMAYEPENEDEEKALVLLGGLYSLKLGIDLEIKINAQNKLEVYGEVRTQGREIVTLARAGLYGHTYTNQMPFGTVEEGAIGIGVGRKVSTIEMNFDKAINEYKLVVTQYNEKNEAGDLKLGGSGNADWTYKMSDIGKDHGFVNKDGKVEITSTNIFKILAQVLGLTNTITIDVVKLVASMHPEPTVEQLLLGYNVEDVKDQAGKIDGKDYIVRLSGSNLTGVKQFGDFDLHIVSRESTYTKNGRKLNFIDQIKTTLDIAGAVKINLNLHSQSGQKYLGYTDMPNMPSHTFTTNQKYRDEYCKNKITLVENGAKDVDDIYEYEGGAIDLPTYETYVVDDKDGAKTKTTRVFDGWWTTENFAEGTRFNEKTMPKQNLTLYAKWIDTVEYYRTITFVTNEDTITENDIVKLEGSDIILPWYSQEIVKDDKETQKLTRKFDGWWTTSTFEEGTRFDENKMPTYDVVLYAKWKDDLKHYYTLKFETGIDEVLTYEEERVLEGDVFEFKTPTQQQITEGNSTTYYTFAGWFTTADYQDGTQWTTDYMPNYDLTLYAKWDTVVETTHQITLLDNNVVVDTLRGIEGRAFDLTGRNKVVTGTGGYDTEFYWDAAYTHKLTAEDFIMPEKDIEIHVRNWYTVTYTSEYGNTATKVYHLLQGSSLTPPTQESYKVDNYGKELTEYIFRGYEENLTVMPNEDKVIKAIWDEPVVTPYFKVSFNLSWYLIWGTCTAGTSMKETPASIADVYVLKGQTLNLNQSQFQRECKAYKTAVPVNAVKFHIQGWSTSPNNDYTNPTGVLSVQVNDNMTLYACWKES